MGIRPCALVAILILLPLIAGPSVAGTMERLLMPGDVTRAHARLEDDCAKCHEPGDRTRQAGLCLDCHKDVAADVTQGRGFHGRRSRSARCSTCHAEHEGRNADIVRLDRTSFDHRQTDFPLTGAHGAVGCDRCHATGKRLREAPQECVACHRKQDPHGGQLGTDCARCHDTAAFRPARFDHSRTSFPLRDAHSNAACSGCHRDPSFKGAPRECAACHAPDDVHRGSRGTDCSQCHNVRAWRESGFDHARASGYVLLGRHARAGCDTCHRGGDLHADLPRDCRSCHSASDRHGGRFGQDCSACHSTDSWKVASFDHTAKGRYTLEGAHTRLGCHSCHTGALKEQHLGTTCVDCHRAHDVHRGSMGKDCAACHRSTGWRDSVRFDHDLAGFPLVGLHVTVACEECHASRAYRETPRECISCHKARDVHKDSLGHDCANCHNPNGWDFWQFDHGRDARFELTGSHARVACRECHRKPAHETRLSSRCADCHQADDAHDGRMGRDCGRCHETESFKAGVVAR